VCAGVVVVAVVIALGCVAADLMHAASAFAGLGALALAGAWWCERVDGRAAVRELNARVEELRLLHEAIEATPTPFALYDAKDRLVAWNSGYRRAHDPGFSRLAHPIRYEELMRSTARMLLPPEEVEAAVAHRVAVHRSADGAPIDRAYPGGYWLRVSKKLTPSGAVAGFATDITELKRREAELLASETRLRDYAETASDWFWETAADHRMSFVSTRLETLGFDAALWIGRTFAEIADDAEAAPESWAQHAATMERREPFREWVFAAASRDGSPRHVSLSGKPIFDPQHGFIGFRGVGRDVTLEKEAELRRHELELRVQHGQRIAALGTLAGGIAHDLNNSMVPIIALSKMMMQRCAPDSPERAKLALVHDAGRRSRDLVKQILAFSRKEEPVKRELDLAALVQDALPMLRATVPATIEIACPLARDLPLVLGDPGQLHQVLINLVTNAVHAIGARSGRIAIELDLVPGGRLTGALEPDASTIRLRVVDNGCGMDKVTVDRIFEPFFTTKEVGEGTGLGLSVVHGIVGGHGGSIDVASEPGHGTSVIVLLPAVVRVSEPAAARSSGMAEAASA
jgi:PAS domain S-box-containing protein